MAGKRLLVYNAQEQHKAWLAGNVIYGMYGDYPPALGLEAIREMLEPKRARLADRHRKINWTLFHPSVVLIVVALVVFALVTYLASLTNPPRPVDKPVPAASVPACDLTCSWGSDVAPGGCVAGMSEGFWVEVCRSPFDGGGIRPPSQTDAPG